jgi:hypothetical protein
MNRKSLKAYHAKKSNKKIVNNVTLTKEKENNIKTWHGHSSGNGLSLYSVHEKKKVHIADPTYLRYGNTLFAKGQHNGHMVSQIVKHQD